MREESTMELMKVCERGIQGCMMEARTKCDRKEWVRESRRPADDKEGTRVVEERLNNRQ